MFLVWVHVCISIHPLNELHILCTLICYNMYTRTKLECKCLLNRSMNAVLCLSVTIVLWCLLYVVCITDAPILKLYTENDMLC